MLRAPGGGGRGVLKISSDGDDRRIFWGSRFSIPGFFGVGKFYKYFLDLSRDVFGYLKQSEDWQKCLDCVVLRLEYKQLCFAVDF